MTILESIVKGVQELPTAQQVEVARYVHRMNEAGQKQRWDLLGRLHGSLSEADGQAFEDALHGSRGVPDHEALADLTALARAQELDTGKVSPLTQTDVFAKTRAALR